MKKSKSLTQIEQRILILRGEKVMLDADLAAIYGVSTKALNQAVKRNHNRFPTDFIFRLNLEEANQLNRSQFATGSPDLRSQFVTSSWGGKRKLPYAFTEHGAVMLASVLKSKIAAEASIQVVRAFIKLRAILAAHKELAQKLERISENTDQRFKAVFELLKGSKTKPKQKIGFRTENLISYVTNSKRSKKSSLQ